MTPSELAIDRCSEAYKYARTLTKAGRVISRMATILTLPLAIGILEQAQYGKWFSFIFFAGMYALIGYAVGKAIAAQGYILRATTDQAVNSCAFLTEAERMDLMSLRTDHPWRLLGIGSAVTPIPQKSARPYQDEGPIQSPIATLFASSPVSSSVYSAPILRSERYLARPARRRSR